MITSYRSDLYTLNGPISHKTIAIHLEQSVTCDYDPRSSALVIRSVNCFNNFTYHAYPCLSDLIHDSSLPLDHSNYIIFRSTLYNPVIFAYSWDKHTSGKPGITFFDLFLIFL